MSRLRRLKERKRKNKIKDTACSLALTLGIVTLQSTTTYALFTDKVQIDNNLSITMGKLDVEIEEVLNVDNLQTNKVFEKDFKIINNGSLNQKIKLKFSKSKSHTLESNNLKYIDYKLDIKTSDGSKVIINKLNDNEVELLNSNRSRLILKSGDYLNCTSTIKIKDNITPELKKLLSEKIINFDITVLASQVNYIGGVIDNNEIGFTDKDSQDNLVKIGEIVEPIEEEVEVPSEPKVVEPPEEEAEVPSEPEVVEPPEEEAEVPIKPEVVEPSKEEAEVPIKPEVVQPPKVEEIVVPEHTDIISQKKEETDIQE